MPASSRPTGTVTASIIMRQLASYPRQNGVAAALRELGRLERTLFTLDWVEDPALRRGATRELNRGESRNSLARAVFLHRLGEIRDHTYENQRHRTSGLNLLVVAIIVNRRGNGALSQFPCSSRVGGASFVRERHRCTYWTHALCCRPVSSWMPLSWRRIASSF